MGMGERLLAQADWLSLMTSLIYLLEPAVDLFQR